MLLYHGTNSVFSKFAHGRSGYGKYVTLPKYNQFGDVIDSYGGGARMIKNPGGIYLTANYWEASAYMAIGSGGITENRILVVDVGRPKIYTCERDEYMQRAGEYGHSWWKFDEVAYEIAKESDSDIVCMRGMEDYPMLRTWENPHGGYSWASDYAAEASQYDQYICHKPELLRIVGEYLHYHQEAA